LVKNGLNIKNIYSDIDEKKNKLNDIQKYKIQLDKDKFLFIKDKYEIIYLWETDIKNDNFKNILKKWNL
jgi:hypothetical protein